METIIGLGSAGCKLANLFSNYPQYETYKIDTGLKGENCFNLQKQNTPEDYERNCPDMASFFESISGDVLFIVAGGGKVSGASLSILKQLKNCKISILYIKPNKNDLSSAALLQERVTFFVFQEYARSGLFEKLYIVSNPKIEDIIGDVPVLQLNKKINEFIVSAIHYINIFSNTEAVVDNYEIPAEVARIATFGIRDQKENEEKYFFDLVQEKNKIYYFAFPEEVLNTDGRLIKNIRQIISDNPIKAGYQIHSTKHAESFCYFVSFSNIIQQLDN